LATKTWSQVQVKVFQSRVQVQVLKIGI